MVLAARLLVRDDLRDTSPTGAAWRLGSLLHLLVGLGAGVVLGTSYVVLAFGLSPYLTPDSAGPLTEMATTPGWPRVAFLLFALVLAPPVEELLFRGVIYGGFCQSFGPAVAAVATTVLFVLPHATGMVHFWPSVFTITALALSALLMRLECRAIGPAVALHLGYNAVVSIVGITWP
jgi:hypothetical protein